MGQHDRERDPSFDEWLAISGILLGYATALDNHDFERLRTVFSEDVSADYRVFTLSGADEMVRRMDAAHRGIRCQHVISNIAIRVHGDGTRASSRCYLVGHLRRSGDPGSLYSTGARYDDELQLFPSLGWRIVTRKATGMWENGTSPEPDAVRDPETS